MAAKRKLPVIGNTGESETDAPRPRWHWIVFGASAVFGAWLPLVYVAALVVKRLISRVLGSFDGPEQAAAALARMTDGDRARLEITIALTYLPAVAFGAAAGGYLVGRWGDPGVGLREAALAGALAALAALALGLSGGGSPWSLAIVVPLATLAAALGGMRGLRRRGS